MATSTGRFGWDGRHRAARTKLDATHGSDEPGDGDLPKRGNLMVDTARGSPPRVAAVIPAYHGGAQLLKGLASLAAGGLRPTTTIVVDNASTDGSIAEAIRLFPAVRFVINTENVGFGQACNQGIQLALASEADYVFLLNQDAWLEPDTLGSMVSLAESVLRAGAVGCKTLSPAVDEAAPTVLYAGAWKTLLPLWQRIPGVGQPSTAVFAAPCKVDYVWGHSMLLRTAALRAAGTFDPRYFMYYEDLDLCDRMQRAGWELWCDNRVTAWHHIRDPARATDSEAWRWQLKQESSRAFHRQRMRWPLSDIFWLLTSARESATLFRHGRGRALGHLLRGVCRVALGCTSARPPGPGERPTRQHPAVRCTHQ